MDLEEQYRRTTQLCPHLQGQLHVKGTDLGQEGDAVAHGALQADGTLIDGA